MDDSTFDAKRRNLLAISVILCFFKYAKASVLPSASISSISLSIGRPDAIPHLLWLLWGYFYVRAYQHYVYHLANEYKRSIQKTLIPILHPHVAHLGIPEEHERFFFEDLERFHKYELRFLWRELPSVTLELLGLPLAWLRYAMRSYQGSRRGPRINLLRNPAASTGMLQPPSLKLNPWGIRIWTISNRPADAPGKMEIGISTQRTVQFWTGLSLYARIATKLTVMSTPFFDYRLPFLLAMVPPFYWLVV